MLWMLEKCFLNLKIIQLQQLFRSRIRIKVEFVCWVAKNTRPFNIVSNHRFKILMKTGNTEYYLPLLTTVSCDVHLVFACLCQHITILLCVTCSFKTMEKPKQYTRNMMSSFTFQWTHRPPQNTDPTSY
ncbi:hypothetical protein CVT25_002461 [Psilocybe cyanescens]|uniref:Uncharacterized protein n=1 Tax=Psilocybe cyanescens TaxID=93625 RepID=A0A409XWD4_PSICY|nr:hypothetical protein CVT25_002461 [Psilocybe cyanescens]